MRRLAWLLVLCLLGLGPASATELPLVRVISTDFVLPGKFARLAGWAAEAGFRLEATRMEGASGEPRDWIEGAALVVLDTPRPSDLASVQQRLGDVLATAGVPWIRVGGGLPAFGALPPDQARQLIGYYGAGGEANFRSFFAYLQRWREGGDLASLPPPARMPGAGFYHPAAPKFFAAAEEYLRWGRERWAPDAPRIAFAIPDSALGNAETGLIDELIARSEAHGLLPLAFWFDAAAPDGLEAVLRPAGADILINLTHMQNGEARRAELARLGLPAISGFTWRGGDRAAWEAAASGLPSGTAAALLVVPEAWGMSDPLVVAAVEKGEAVPIPAQVEALLAKAGRLAALRRRPPQQKRLALMFWNYPPGEKNLSASNLNLPRSLEVLTRALAEAGYAVPPTEEAKLIEAGQAMLGGLHRPETLDALLAAGLADTLPVSAYRAWLDGLPEARRKAVLERWGEPEASPTVREIAGERQFVIPRLLLGNLAVLPQPPRGGTPGEAYHDAVQPPAHLYMAAYLWLRQRWEADALINFGTHGTQEWLPGKDRGLSAADFPFLAVADLPVFYPYIQDNVGEAMQARRRGRAVTISHQTPPFAPAGLYDELRDLHALIHDHAPLEEGAVRARMRDAIMEAVRAANLHRDMGWEDSRIAEDFSGFLAALHDHLHLLTRQATPLGLHSFGVAAPPEDRLATVMQQLGEPFYERLGLNPQEVFADTAERMRESTPYLLLHRYLREGVPVASIEDAELRAMVERAAALDRHLADTQEVEALLTGLAGGFVLPGPGGDPVRNPEVPSGRNLHAFEPDRLPSPAAYAAGEEALRQLIDSFRAEHGGEAPRKIAFSLWSSEAIRHQGITEAQVLHALGLRPVRDAASRLRSFEIIPREELGRPRIDVVVQVTSVYRDQFDHFMRLLAEAIDRLSAMDEPGNAVAANSATLRQRLLAQGLAPERAAALVTLRIFSNAPGDYGSGLPGAVLDSTAWNEEAPLAERFLARLQYAYGHRLWGERLDGGNLLAEQLRGVQAAVLSRSSNLNGVLSTDHPFEYLGGLSLAVRHLDGATPSLFIADLRRPVPRMSSAAGFLAEELRSRAMNPQWIAAMQREGYAGTLAIVNLANNLFGWQVTDPGMVRADQWQAMHDTFIRDVRQLGLDAWFEAHNPTAQAQVIARMAEAIRKGYWDPDDRTRSELAARYTSLVEQHEVSAGAAETQRFLAEMAGGFGLQSPATPHAPSAPEAAEQAAPEAVRGQLLQPLAASAAEDLPWTRWAVISVLLLCLLAGGLWQHLSLRQTIEASRK
jgi:cobaltochelatase CobN